jgi:hypothetical protein
MPGPSCWEPGFQLVTGKTGEGRQGVRMVVIRRVVDRHRAYTAIFLPGEEPKMFPTTDYEHGRILQIYKQDRPYEGVHNDFSDYALGSPGKDGK